MKKGTKGKVTIAVIIVVLVAAIAMLTIMIPRFSSKKAAGADTGTMENINASEDISESPILESGVNPAGPNEGTMENVDPIEYVAEPVDLGLSVKWASFNVGASKPEEYGGLYGWGDATGTKTSTDNANYPSNDPPENISGTEYDIARAKWGGSWRLPTKEEQDELVEKCDWKKGSYQGIKGYTVTGPNGNTIFLPAVGGRIEDKTYYQVDGADYWSGTLGAEPDTAYYLYYYIGEEPTVGTLPRYYGFAVRAVCN